MPKIGDSVLYRIEDGQDRAAIVTCVWSESVVNLAVIVDGANDIGGDRDRFPFLWKTSVEKSEQALKNTWYAPEA